MAGRDGPWRSRVLGCGGYLPERIVTNEELARRVDTSDEWIVGRTGIRQRHIAAEGNREDGRPVALDEAHRRVDAARPEAGQRRHVPRIDDEGRLQPQRAQILAQDVLPVAAAVEREAGDR